MVSKMETRVMWTAVDHVCRVNNVLMDWDVTVDQTALVLSAHQIFVKASIVTYNVKYLTLYIVVPTCSDGVKNGNEIDVDCGGSCLPTNRCRETQKCINPSDCISGICRSNICQGECSH